MIARMAKVYLVVHTSDRDRLLEALRELGVIHLAPVDPVRAVAEERTVEEIGRLERARQILSNVVPAGPAPDVPPLEAAEEVLRLQRESAEARSRLSSLYRQLHQLSVWGDVRLTQFEELRELGVEAQFFSVPNEELGEIQAELVHFLAPLPGKRSLVGIVDRSGQVKIPDSASVLTLPPRDRPSIRAEAKEIDAALKRNSQRQAQLAHLLSEMSGSARELRTRAQYTVAEQGGLAEEHLYAVQGWVPEEMADTLHDSLREAGIESGVQALPPVEDEEPPTLIRYPRWARPIKGLFDILGTFPGYEEHDLSPFFMVALPLFAAMLIGDAGYGLIFLALPLLTYRRVVEAAGKAKTQLLIVIGAVTLVWGVLTGNYFGVTPSDLAMWGGFDSLKSMREGFGFCATFGKIAYALGVLWHPDEETARFLIIKVSFIIGSIHLIVAHVCQAVGYFPNRKTLSEVGWCGVLAGMLAVIWKLFDFAMPDWLLSMALGFLVVGYVLAVLFAFPEHRIGKRIGLGFASSLLPIIAAFGDTMSYIRLMAVGLASYYIAAAFNSLGATVAEGTAWLWIAGVPIILFGHALNIGLAVIAIFAHGVRLNMLEFSNNAGVQWAGYPYEPFAKQYVKES
jgi:V/A-type H+-transporting ATPase subunit I